MQHTRRRHKKIPLRFTSTLSRWWRNLCLRWYTTDKLPLIVVALSMLTLAGFGYALYAIFAHENDRRNLTCLALNVYFEARGEPTIGQYAVAEVTMNRVASKYYPDTVCDVVYQKNWDPLRRRYVGHFSWTEFDTRPSPKDKEWTRAWEVAEAVYHGKHAPQLDGVLLYHSIYVQPSWSVGRKPAARIGKHIFYK